MSQIGIDKIENITNLKKLLKGQYVCSYQAWEFSFFLNWFWFFCLLAPFLLVWYKTKFGSQNFGYQNW